MAGGRVPPPLAPSPQDRTEEHTGPEAAGGGANPVREIDPMVEGSELLKDKAAAFKVEPKLIHLRSVRLQAAGSQVAIVDISINAIPRSLETLRVRSGLTVVRMRALPKLLRRFRCHQLGHVARNCLTMEEGKERCRRCGANDHIIGGCMNLPRCVICTAVGITGPRAAHVAASLVCPANRRGRGAEY